MYRCCIAHPRKVAWGAGRSSPRVPAFLLAIIRRGERQLPVGGEAFEQGFAQCLHGLDGGDCVRAAGEDGVAVGGGGGGLGEAGGAEAGGDAAVGGDGDRAVE